MRHCLVFVFSFLLGLFVYGFFSPAQTYAYRINLFKIDGSSAQLRNNGTFVKGDPILVEINEVDVKGSDVRWLAEFNSDAPKTPFHQIKLFYNNFFCEAEVADDPAGRWSVGTDSRNPPELFGQPYCGPEEILHLYLSTDGAFSCGSGGNATCTIRVSKKNQQFVDNEDPGPKTEVSQSFKIPEGVTSTIPVVSLSQSVVTTGEPLTLSISSVLPKTTYDIKVTFENDTSQAFGTAEFTTGNTAPICGDKGKLKNTYGQGFSVGRSPADQVEWCLGGNEYYIQLNTAGYFCEGNAAHARCLVQVTQRDDPQLSGPNQAIFSVIGTSIQITKLPAAIPWGNKQNILIIKIPKMGSRDATYTVTLSKSTGSKVASYTFKIKKNGSNSDGCDVSDGGSTLITKPENNACYYKNTVTNKDTFSNYAILDTSKLPQPKTTFNDRSGKITGFADSYKITVDIDGDNKNILPQALSKSFFVEYDPSKLKVTMSYTRPVTDPLKADPDQWDKPKAEFNFYEGEAIIEAAGCPVGTDMEFTWQRGDAADCNDTSCTYRSDKDDDSHTEKVKSNGKASFAHSFSTDGKSDIYVMITKCKAGTASTKTLFRAFRQGEEYVTLPIVIAANTEWPVTLGGLDASHHLCYYIRISKTSENHTNEDFNIPVNKNDITCGGEKSIIDDDKKPVIMSRITEEPSGPNTWGIQNTVNIGGLESGYYKFYLYSANAKSKADWGVDQLKWAPFLLGPAFLPIEAGAAVTGWLMDKVTNTEGGDDPKARSENGIEFCVNVCRNDGQAFPPGKAPCLIGTDKDGNLVDARPESEQKDNPYKYTNKDNQQVTAKPGTRDDILTCTVVPTAFGNIDTSPQGIVKSLLQLLLSVAGGVALILILIAGYKIMTSRGNPEQLQDAKEQLTSAIVGLLFIIFSVVILETIGVDLLHIPGFGV